MKIEELRFKNLNSLAGEWRIDFSHPAYDAAGIFAITGPTGAGKTTLLDAICLALYGQTPRLDMVTKSTNDIMSRQTGECFAEVTFSTQSGRYRVIWSQHRARKSPQGDLQVPQREVADAVSGVILESSLRRVSEKIIELTGMDFERFTRAVVLAQGGFAAFLQASPDERAPILEQITGTEIYSHISMSVHERRGVEREKLAVLEAAVSGIAVMDAETFATVTAAYQQHRDAVGGVQKSLAVIQTAITWHEALVRLDEEVDLATKSWEVFSETWHQSASDRQRFDAATKAMSMSGEYVALTTQRLQQKSALETLRKIVSELPQLVNQVAVEKVALEAGETALQMAKEKEAMSRPIVHAIRKLDTEIQEKQKGILGLEDTFRQTQKSRDESHSHCQQTREIIARAEKSLETARGYLNENSRDSLLVESWSVLVGHAKRMVTLYQELRASDAAVANTEAALMREVLQLSETKALLQIASDVLAAETQRYLSAETSFMMVTEGQEESVWRLRLDQQREHRRQLQHVIETDKKRHALQSAIATAQAEQSQLKTSLAHALQQQDSLAREVALLEHAHQLRARIQTLEIQRRLLVVGEACPLCGSPEHPYLDHGLPELVGEDVATAKLAYESQRKNVETLTVAIAQLGATVQHLASELHDLPVGMASWCEMSADSRILADTKMADEISQLEKRVDTIVTAGKVFGLAKEGVSQSKDSLTLAEKTHQETLHRHALLQQQVSDQQHVAGTCRDLLRAEFTQFCALLPGDSLLDEAQNQMLLLEEDPSPLSFSTIFQRLVSETLPGIFEVLKTRRMAFESARLEFLSLEKSIATDTATLGGQLQMLQHLETTLSATQTALRAEVAIVSDLLASRHSQYGSQNPDQIEAEAAQTLAQAELAYTSMRVGYDTANARYEQMLVRHSETEGLCQGYTERLHHLVTACDARFHGLGFENEQDYLSAKMSDVDYAALQQVLVHLEKEKTVLETRLADKRAAYREHHCLKVTDIALETLREMRDQHLGQMDVLQREIGALAQQLSDHEKHAAQLVEQVAVMGVQKEVYDRWALLHEMIGSSDGKKYRNFAQGLTFERMVHVANHHLHKMTDRYTLIRDVQQPLSLNVVDHYQSDSVRVTRNLSGGESFIVSLALALGLSQMSSRNVRLDSLFLDEGFGTLDEEVLETALSTLSSLHHEGKRIGVISHVQALKDRIGTKILVLPESGGRSCLEGHGVSRGDNRDR